jgi:hypothetical protein
VTKTTEKDAKNVNCLEGIECPRCGAQEPFHIWGSAVFEVHDDGTEETTEHEWEDHSRIACMSCSHGGTIYEFRMRDQKKAVVPKVIVEVSGGRVSSVLSDAEISVEIVDYDDRDDSDVRSDEIEGRVSAGELQRYA